MSPCPGAPALEGSRPSPGGAWAGLGKLEGNSSFSTNPVLLTSFLGNAVPILSLLFRLSRKLPMIHLQQHGLALSQANRLQQID